jgi:hypothetical protein
MDVFTAYDARQQIESFSHSQGMQADYAQKMLCLVIEQGLDEFDLKYA